MHYPTTGRFIFTWLDGARYYYDYDKLFLNLKPHEEYPAHQYHVYIEGEFDSAYVREACAQHHADYLRWKFANAGKNMSVEVKYTGMVPPSVKLS